MNRNSFPVSIDYRLSPTENKVELCIHPAAGGERRLDLDGVSADDAFEQFESTIKGVLCRLMGLPIDRAQDLEVAETGVLLSLPRHPPGVWNRLTLGAATVH